MSTNVCFIGAYPGMNYVYSMESLVEKYDKTCVNGLNDIFKKINADNQLKYVNEIPNKDKINEVARNCLRCPLIFLEESSTNQLILEEIKDHNNVWKVVYFSDPSQFNQELSLENKFRMIELADSIFFPNVGKGFIPSLKKTEKSCIEWEHKLGIHFETSRDVEQRYENIKKKLCDVWSQIDLKTENANTLFNFLSSVLLLKEIQKRCFF